MKRSNELRVPLPCTDHEKIVQEVKLAAADANGEPLLYPLFGKGEEGRQGGFRIGSGLHRFSALYARRHHFHIEAHLPCGIGGESMADRVLCAFDDLLEKGGVVSHEIWSHAVFHGAFRKAV